MTRTRPITLGGWLALAALAAPTASYGQQAADDSCMTCHGALGDERLSGPAEHFSDDIHAAQGIGCSGCHGGDPSVMGPASMDPEVGYIGVPNRQFVPEVCGRCHSSVQFMRRFNPAARVDQVTEYWTSVHGQRLAADADSAVATCSSCHPAHRIRPATDPQSSVYPLNVAGLCGGCHADGARMTGYGLSTDQREEYEASVHWQMMSEGGDLSAPTCNDCHGNHGAAPPGVGWVGNVCGQCHAVEAGLYSSSFHSQILTVMGSPGCATCHGNHEIHMPDDTMLGTGEGAVCSRCHTADSRGGETAAGMRALIDSLANGFEEADSLLHRAEEAGMEVSQAQFDLNDARNALVHARTAIHAFSLDSVRVSVESGLEVTTAANQRGLGALRELRTRRVGLTVSAAIILLLIAGLVLKIRQIEGAG